MSKRLTDLYTTFSELPYEEKEKIVKRIRHNKYVARPALKKRQGKKKQAKQKASDKKLIDLLKGMSPEEVAKILGEQGEQNGE